MRNGSEAIEEREGRAFNFIFFKIIFLPFVSLLFYLVNLSEFGVSISSSPVAIDKQLSCIGNHSFLQGSYFIYLFILLLCYFYFNFFPFFSF